jgi:hypothetical protein
MSEVTTEKVETDAEKKEVLVEEDGPDTWQADENMAEKKETFSEEETTLEKSFTSQTSHRPVVADPPKIFKVPKVPHLKPVFDRPVEHIHFDKKWAAKRGEIFDSMELHNG